MHTENWWNKGKLQFLKYQLRCGHTVVYAWFLCIRVLYTSGFCWPADGSSGLKLLFFNLKLKVCGQKSYFAILFWSTPKSTWGLPTVNFWIHAVKLDLEIDVLSLSENVPQTSCSCLASVPNRHATVAANEVSGLWRPMLNWFLRKSKTQYNNADILLRNLHVSGELLRLTRLRWQIG